MWPWPDHLLRAGELPSEDRDPSTSWRQVQLLRTGFEPALAASIARERAFDLHALIELVERGCPPELAARIREHRASVVLSLEGLEAEGQMRCAAAFLSASPKS